MPSVLEMTPMVVMGLLNPGVVKSVAGSIPVVSVYRGIVLEMSRIVGLIGP